MKFAGVRYLLVAAVFAFGCSSAGGVDSPAGDRDAGPGGGSGYGGSGPVKVDAGAISDGALGKNDGSTEPVGSNLTTDAVTFNWDPHVCSGCLGGGGATSGGGGSSGSGGASAGTGAGGRGAGGASGIGGSATGADASVGVGGSAAGGAMVGSGGRPASGGATGGGGYAGSSGGQSDAGVSPDVATDVRLPLDSPGLPSSDASPDAVGGAGGSDLGPSGPDARPSDVVTSCQARIVPVIPALDRIDRLVAGENARIVLRAVADAGGPSAATPWTWTATWDGAPLAVAQAGVVEPDTAAFTIANPGNYTFTARAGNCFVQLPGYAVAPNACASCDKSVVLRAAPPATSDVPVQSGALTLLGSSPFDQSNPILARGVAVKIAASIGSGLVTSYVRINDAYGGLVADGLADANVGGFATRLRALDNNRSALRYDVLVVPLDGEDGATIAATAPQLYPGRDPNGLNSPLPLTGGRTITGTTLDVNGRPVADARVMLTNQDPSSMQQRHDLVFSSVGRSDAQGKFTLHVQGGPYWVSFAPPIDSGLTEILSDSSVSVASDSTLSFQWSAPTTAALSLKVVDSAGVPAPGVSVRLTSSSQSSGVGTLSGALISSQQAKGNVQVEDTTDATGAVLFAKLPANTDYDVLLMPASPGAYSATTATAVRLEAGGTSKQVSLVAQSIIKGRLVVRAASPVQIDLATVSIVAYDRSSDAPEAPRAIMANADGSFLFGVTPNRRYILVAVPDIGSGYARTFVGPGPMQASEYVVTQALLTSTSWKAKVMDENQNGLTDTALQVYCDATWPNCVDPAVPLAETTSSVGGAFQLELADPGSRF